VLAPKELDKKNMKKNPKKRKVNNSVMIVVALPNVSHNEKEMDSIIANDNNVAKNHGFSGTLLPMLSHQHILSLRFITYARNSNTVTKCKPLVVLSEIIPVMS